MEIIEKMNVDVVISGHDHNYERSHRIRNVRMDKNGEITFQKADDQNGTYFIVSGGGGADMRDMKPRSKLSSRDWIAYRRPDPDLGQTAARNPFYHYLLIDIKSNIKRCKFHSKQQPTSHWFEFNTCKNGRLQSETQRCQVLDTPPCFS